MIVTEDDVKYALRHLHDDNMLSKSALAGRLQLMFSASSAREAVIVASDAAFRALRPSSKVDELRNVIFAGGIEPAASRQEAASALGLSLRSFFRKQKHAIAVIAGYLNELLDSDDAVSDRCAKMLAPTRPLAAPPDARSQHDQLFDSIRLSFQSHQRIGDANAMRSDIEKLIGYKHLLSFRDQADLTIMQAEIAVRFDRIHEASKLLESLFETLPAYYSDLWRNALLVKARLSFSVGHLLDAQQLCNTILNASLVNDDVSEDAAVLRARACVLSEAEWHPSLGDGVPALWLQIVTSRYHLREKRYDLARDMALRVYEESIRDNHLAVATHAAAILSGSYSGALREKREFWALRSLSLLAACGSDPCISRDLFQFGATLNDSTAWFCDSPQSVLAAIYLSLRPASESARSKELARALPLLLNAVLLKTYDRSGQPATLLEQIIEIVNEAASDGRTAGGLLTRELPHVIAFGKFLSVLIPTKDQPAFVRRFSSAAGITVRSAIRSIGYQQLRALSIVS